MIGAPLDPPTLRGSSLSLRPYQAGFSEDEIQALYAWSRDQDLLALCGTQPLELGYRRFRELFLQQARRSAGGAEQLFAILEGGRRIIGRIGLFGLSRQVDPLGLTGRAGVWRPTRQAELGIMIGDRAVWGQGLGREAVRLLVDHAFAAHDLETVVLYTFPHNLRAQQAFRAVGFGHERLVRRFSLAQGAHDELEMRITRQEQQLRLGRPDRRIAVPGRP